MKNARIYEEHAKDLVLSAMSGFNGKMQYNLVSFGINRFIYKFYCRPY